MSQAQIYQIKITLNDSKPPIWRRILVRGDSTLGDLHRIIQAALGWWDYHLHQFIVEGTYYGQSYPEYSDYVDMQDEDDVELAHIVTGANFKFRYEYDFGDNWQHTLLVEKILSPKPGQQYPVCIKGKRACPPEDVGGIWGYYGFLDAIQSPDHPDHDMYLEWIGDEFDPQAFDLDSINAALRDLS